MTVSHAILFLSILASSCAIRAPVDRDFSQVDICKLPHYGLIRTRCPDALACEAIFDEVLREVGRQKMDLSLVYVAELNSTDGDFGVTCKHGLGECAGNVQQLCVAKYASPSAWWEFVQCQNSHGRFQVGLPDVAFKCAETAGIDWEASGVGNCASLDGSGKGAEGLALLRKSLSRGKALGIEKSCTVLINRKEVCVRDETWTGCEGRASDFIKQINSEYERINGKVRRQY
ncbi:hypothetical protein B0H19DRAFT_1213306 [Mycena capillaripes]|nr:hypothetical protein B0H19DRAFT_1213306 [Mycena capillaripes]